jgi:hypothetical protein
MEGLLKRLVLLLHLQVTLYHLLVLLLVLHLLVLLLVLHLLPALLYLLF